MSCLVFFTVLLAVLAASDGRSVEGQTEKAIGSQQTGDVVENAGRDYLPIGFVNISGFQFSQTANPTFKILCPPQ